MSSTKRRRNAALATVVALVTLLLVRWAWLGVTERYAVAALLDTGASVAFESDYADRDEKGSYTFHKEDERNPLIDFLELMVPPPPTQARGGFVSPRRQSGAVKEVSLENDKAVEVLLDYRTAFAAVEAVSIEREVGDATAGLLFDAIEQGDFRVTRVECRAAIMDPATLDCLLRLRLKTLLLSFPAIRQNVLSAIAENGTIESLWIDESPGRYYLGGNPNRYAAADFTAIASRPQLRELYLVGLEIDDARGEALAAAMQLERLTLSGCQVSPGAREALQAALTNTKLSVPPAADETDAEGDQ